MSPNSDFPSCSTCDDIERILSGAKTLWRSNHATQSHATGSQNTGSQNTGSQNTGSQNAGSQNAGSQNAGSRSIEFVAASPMGTYRMGRAADCPSAGLSSAVTGVKIGAVFGIGQAMIDAMRNGLHPSMLAPTAMMVAESSVRTGMFLGTYRLLHCYAQPRIRNRIATAAVAGGATGAIFALPTAIAAKDPRGLAAASLVTAAMAALFESFFH
eukprot:TRINITY_DN661_c0_g1_i1.p1 TRINITY_DN661_c0_g1~~TRINITY_DN661_c0_g1_i1.p1  ORF type:complete len:213 (-),score=35.67 TRINITY_DN661_c0_g1_i1:371-1009(-)